MPSALRRYEQVLSGCELPRFRSVNLSVKVKAATKILSSCRFCERNCRADRLAGSLGICRADSRLRVASAFDHLGEEPFFVPSFTIFFPSCTFKCIYCQNWDISQVESVAGIEHITAEELAVAINNHGHCRNVNFVGGDPTPYLAGILEALTHVRVDIPVVWNSNFYMSVEGMQLLQGVVDVYLPDFKYGNDDCASELSGAHAYSRIVRRNLASAANDAEVVIRHLILPGHIDCCTKPILEHIASEFGRSVVVNIMDQYRPCYRVERGSTIDRRISSDELGAAIDHAERLGICYIS